MASRMDALVRAKDWSRTPLGPIEGWSPALKTVTGILLVNRFPMLLWWGPDSISIYNDAYAPALGVKHPAALGQPVRECWSEIYDVLEPLIQTPLRGGPATWSDDLRVDIRRHGFLEETHWTIAYSPVPDDTVPGGIGGVLATVHEITQQVVGQRRSSVLRELGTRPSVPKSAEEACFNAAAVLARQALDLPFAAIYLVDADGRGARRVAGAAAVEVAPPFVELSSAEDPIARALRTRSAQPTEGGLVVPFDSHFPGRAAGAVVLGISPRLVFDGPYRGFLELVTDQIAAAITNARAYEDERGRSDALALLDRAKTVFFGNVSHELRTPLTLMLGPAEDALRDSSDALSPPQRERVETIHRGAVRLLKLVNTLLDFNRLEDGHASACYQPTELAQFTAEIASTFRSLVEQGGVKLIIDCPPLPDSVFVDRQMWEKIVLNLVSNAFKFTLQGEIVVRLEVEERQVRLSVRDTGTGVAAEELPHLFERFHRVAGARGRTYEGTGIGLALVRELASIHGGTATVESVFGQGSTFGVTVPLGKAHLPADRVQAPTPRSRSCAEAYVEEATGWLDDATGEMTGDHEDGGARLLVADDNADMRAYLSRLLRALGTVEVVKDGKEALAAALRHPPDLVLSDVMMPNLDGLGLVRALREDPRTRKLPIVLISARAGEEARIEGASHGADDYVVKPFSSRELFARVRTQLALARQRRQAEQTLETANRQLLEIDQQRDDFIAMLSHELRNPLAPIQSSLELLEATPQGGEQAVRALSIIGRQVDHLQSIIDDLLDVTRIARGKIALQLQAVDVNLAAAQSVEDHREDFAKAGVELALLPASTAVCTQADPARLAQVLGNLLQNAMKFTPRGGRTELSVSSGGSGSFTRAIVRVRDTGRGIEPELLTRLFDPFIQADMALDRQLGGLGLGLAVTKGLVQLHGGTIYAESDGPGRGATMVVSLPLDEASSRAMPPAPILIPIAPRRVLVVEDNEDARESLRDLLELKGHAVEVARSGGEALARAHAFRPDVVLCDIGLPEMDGYEVARRFRADETLRSARLVALSGYARPEDLARGRAAGFDAHLAKPVKFSAVTELLEA